MDTVLTTPAHAAPRAKTAAVIAPPPPGARSCWRRLIQTLDPTSKGAFALHGHTLRPAAAYELPDGALVITCDLYDTHRTVRLLRVQNDALEPIKTWELKAKLGQRIVHYTARRLAPDAPGHRAIALEALPNRYESACRLCHNRVAVGDGLIDPHPAARPQVRHRPGTCPPPPARRNRYAGTCVRCDGWVEAVAGVLHHDPDPLPERGEWLITHDGPCPDRPAPAPVRQNRYAAWCADCGALVEPGMGRYERGQGILHPTGQCPAPAPYPTWRVYRPLGARDVQAGEVFLARITPRAGRDSEPPVDAPAFRVLDVDWFEFAALALQSRETCDGAQAVRVRAATLAEAEPLLARQLTDALDAIPDAHGFKALHEVERIGPRASSSVALTRVFAQQSRPWAAEITGRSRWYGYQRRFLAPRRDYSQANRRGTRGVVYGWTLSINRIYQAQWPTGWRGATRVFLRATPEGDTEEITGRQVEAWLNEAPAWLLAGAGEH